MDTHTLIEFSSEGDEDRLLTALSNVYRPTSAIAVAERLAANLIAKSSVDLYQTPIDEEVAVALIEQFAQAQKNLKARLEILASAEARVMAWAIATGLESNGVGAV